MASPLPSPGTLTNEYGNTSSILSTATRIYGPLLIGGFATFELVRRIFPNLYNCKANALPISFGAWIPYVWFVDDDTIMEECGLDSLLFIRFIHVCKHLAGFALLLSFGLIPAYSTKIDLTNEDFLDRLTISVLPRDDERLWATVFAATAMSLFTMYCVSREFQVYKQRRHEFLSKDSTQQYSVLIDDIPAHLRSHTALKKYFNALFPNQVAFCYIAVECRDLERLVEKRENVRNSLEHAIVVLRNTSRRSTHLEWHGGCSFESVDSISTYERSLQELNVEVATVIREIEAQQKHGSFYINSTRLEDGSRTTVDGAQESTPLLTADVPRYVMPDLATSKVLRRSAFVTFSTLQATNTVQQIVQTATPHEMRIQEAPPSEDIIWANVGTFNYEQRQFFALVTIAATTVLILFWTVPTTLVVALSSVDSLRHVIPHLNDLLTEWPSLESLLQQLSPIGLVLMNSLAPLLLRLLSLAEGHTSQNAIEASLFAKVVTFQLVQTFIVASVAGSLSAIADKIQLVLEQPLQIIPMLGRSIPGQSTLFVSYIFVQTGLSLIIQLLRITPLFLGLIYWICSPNLTPREKAAPWFGLTPATISARLDVTTTLAQHFLIFLLILTFAPLAPVVSAAGGIYFLVSDLIYRRQLLCVYTPGLHSTGLHWPQLYTFFIAGLFVSQLTLIGVLTLKQAPKQAVVALLLPGLTALFHWWIRQLYPNVAEYLPVEVCAKLDQARRGRSPSLDRTLYKQPAMTQKTPLGPELGPPP